MKKINLVNIILFSSVIWGSYLYVFIPHLVWIPGFMGTWFMSKNLTIYKDFIQPHFPFTQFLLYPIMKLTSWNIGTDAFLAFSIYLLTIIILYKLGKKYLDRFGLSISIIIFSLYYWYFSTWTQFSQEALIGLIILPLTFGLLKKNYTAIYVFFWGVGLALAELSSQIASVSLLFMVLYLFLKLLKMKKSKIIKNMLFGIFTPLILISLYFLFQNSIKDFFYWNAPYYLVYSKLARSIKNIPPVDIIIYFYLVLIPLLFSRKILLFLLLVSSVPFIVFGVYHPHHFLYILPVQALAWGFTFNKFFNYPKYTKILFILIFLIFSVVTFYELTPWYVDRIQKKPLKNLSQLSGDLLQIGALNWIERNSNSESTMLVTGDPLFYYRADRLPSNIYFSSLPYHYLPLEKTKEIIDKSLPDFWIIDKQFIERLVKGWKTPEISEFIKYRLNKCYLKKFENKEWEIWKKNCSAIQE